MSITVLQKAYKRWVRSLSPPSFISVMLAVIYIAIKYQTFFSIQYNLKLQYDTISSSGKSLRSQIREARTIFQLYLSFAAPADH